MNRPLTVIFLSVLLLVSCSKQEAPQPPAEQPVPPPSETEVVSTEGTGAVMVIHPEPANFDRSAWMVQVSLTGEKATSKLPVVPLADLTTAVVMHVQPGTYTVVSSAFIRRNPPATGGSLEGVTVNSGEVVVLKAVPLNGDPYPHSNTRLELIDRLPWTLPGNQGLHNYIAGLVKKSAQG